MTGHSAATIEPAFPQADAAVVFSSDGNYVPYLAAALASLIKLAAPQKLYDLVVLSCGIDPEDQTAIKSMAQGRENISLRFFDVRDKVERLSGGFFINAHISAATYYRLFTPSIFEKYQRLIYLDVDIAVLADVAELYAIDLEGAALGAALDFFAVRDLPRPSSAKWAAQLGLQSTAGYFNAGVLVMDLQQLRRGGFEARWFERLKQVKTPRLHDQDILNHTMEGRVKFIDSAWNSLAWMESLGEDLRPGQLPEDLYNKWRASVEAPKILHFSSRHKPWDLPHLKLADTFWGFACHTPYYDRLIFENLKRLNRESDLYKARLRFPPTAAKYWFYRLMSFFTFGDLRYGYQSRAGRIKAMGGRLKPFLRSWH